MNLKLENKKEWDKIGTACPECNPEDRPRGGVLIIKKGKYGSVLACDKYPECKFQKNL
jgi:ssDNA-binding Zn-finger/Zn-ribbon topoisomerase 1